MKNLNLFFAAAIGLVAIGCSNNQGNSKVKQNIDINVDVSADINRAQQVFYALPSPIETAHLIQSAGVSYNMDLSNPVDNAEKYSTTMKKALNFGVYGADLSYASLFNQTQTTIQFMATEKKIAEELGIYDFVDADGVKIRKDESYEKNYLLGKYGAIPTLRSFDMFTEA